MFLKRVEMQGFKSFADRTIVTFDNPVTGIVGPNGCGKSNISDAIRWVLGEQSVKSLRGEKMSDVIFSGSQNRKAQNMAEVTLVFDNSNHYLNSELEELEVTRKIYKNDDETETEYLINHKNVRLRDVQDLIMDTGLGKDSLSMISQGNITSFAEARPYDRRAIFEEAAGVSKYKKRKIESLGKLERTKENLDRTLDILNELERQVNPLRRQAKKAELYLEKKKRLEAIEIAVLVDEIRNLNSEKSAIEKDLFDLDTTIAMHKTSIQVHENDIFESRNKVRELDKEINTIQEKIVNTINEIRILEGRKVEVEEQRKYVLQAGNTKEKMQQLKNIVEEAKLEYDDRVFRYNALNTDIELLNRNLEETAVKLADASLKKEETANIVNRMENRIEVLKNVLRDPFSSNTQFGVKTIMENKSSFYGIMGVVGQEIHPSAGYENALATALAGSVYHIVTKDEEAARRAISFLKKNRTGRATFLPLNVLKSRFVKYEDEIICKNTEGYLGTMREFVECSSEYSSIRDSLLGNILVVNTLENANILAGLLKYQYAVVTLDGEIVHRGGSMTGGKVKNETSIVTAHAELDRLTKDIDSYRAENELAAKTYASLVSSKESIDSSLTEKRIAIAQLEPVIEAKRAKYEKALTDYNMLSPENLESKEAFENELISNLNEQYSLRDSLSTSNKIKRDEKMKLSADIDRKEQQLRQIRRQLDSANSNIIKVTSDKSTIETKLESDLSRLASEYQMTFEYAVENSDIEIAEDAKEEVITLRKEIEDLGNINMNAPEEFSQINERYEFLKKNYDDLVASRDKILSAIEEMDQIMIKQFKETFDKINVELDTTFKSLFGGGKARLVLEDETDILNTGIEIDVNPPGKSVKSRLFSGGEKSLIAICVLFTILKVSSIPLIVFDEIEASLDQANVERFAKYVKSLCNTAQFLIITHRPGTMAQCDVLYGVTMQNRGVSQMLKVKLVDAIGMTESQEEKGEAA